MVTNHIITTLAALVFCLAMLGLIFGLLLKASRGKFWRKCSRCGRYFDTEGETRFTKPATDCAIGVGVCDDCGKAVRYQ